MISKRLMKSTQIKQRLNLIIEKDIKNIKGFYTHFFASFVILPFLVFINLQTVPQFQWFWYAIIAWCIGLFIHWINVFVISKMGFKETWKENKIKEIINSENSSEFEEDYDYIQEKYYLKAKKQTKQIKGFYLHLLVSVISFLIILFANLKLVPDFYFFWFALIGMLIALFFHWLGVFGFEVLGLGKQWEERKTVELLKKYQ